METLQFPFRLIGFGARLIIELPEPMGVSAKIFMRNVAKNQFASLYHQKIQTGICGRSDDGKDIPINSIGRWLFGVPGYMGHVRVSNWQGTVCIVDYPKDSHELVHGLLNKVKAEIELLVNINPPTDGNFLEAAMTVVNKFYPEASTEKKAAFANSVSYLVTAASGGFGGPSVREHAVSHTYCHQNFSYPEAVKLLLAEDGLIFGPLQDIHHQCWQVEHCFDDDPNDLVELGLPS